MKLMEQLVCHHVTRQLRKMEPAGTRSRVHSAPPPLQVFLFGFSGVRNAGADARMEEAVRQITHIAGKENLSALSFVLGKKAGGMFTQTGFDYTEGYFQGSTRITAHQRLDRFIFEQAGKNHISMVVEGAVFKSNLSNMLTMAFAGLMGAADRAGNLSFAWGVEAGKMDPPIQRLVRWACQDSHIIVRNKSSQKVLQELSLQPVLGTDNAWTFHPKDPSFGEKTLKDAGWDGQTPVISICPINPFWVPSATDPVKWLQSFFTDKYSYAHRGGMTFHRTDPEAERKHSRYLGAVADAVTAHLSRFRAFPVIIGTSLIDSRSCRMLSALLNNAPIFGAERYDMFETVSLLRKSSLIVTSRFHGAVLAMPEGVPFVAVTLDERLENLLEDIRRPDLSVHCDDLCLAEKLTASLESAVRDQEEIRSAAKKHVLSQLKVLAEMGRTLEREILCKWPQLPLPQRGSAWQEYLPLTDPVLKQLVHS